MSRALVYGNGKSRLKWDLNQELQDNITTWGCNRIYNDVKVDNLVAVDYWIQHMVYESGYAKTNKCWFLDWQILPVDFDITPMRLEYYNHQENEKNTGGKVVRGKDQPPLKGLYITWVDENDMVEDIDFPKEWGSGTTAIHLACQQGAKEIYLIGFDLSANPINNVYEEEQKKFKINDDNRPFRFDWTNELKTTIKEYPNTNFIWVDPSETTLDFFNYSSNNLTYDTYENIRRKICR